MRTNQEPFPLAEDLEDSCDWICGELRRSIKAHRPELSPVYQGKHRAGDLSGLVSICGYSGGACCSASGFCSGANCPAFALLPLARSVHQLFDARLKAARTVGKKAEFRHRGAPPSAPSTQSECSPWQPPGKRSVSELQPERYPSHRAVEGHVNACRLPAGIKRYFSDVTEANTGIGEFALDHGSDLQPQSFRYPVLMMLARALCSGMTPSLRYL